MSRQVIRKLLETAINSVPGGLPTAWSNVAFTPSFGTPWQRVNLMSSSTQNPMIGGDSYRESGYVQILLMYPEGAGPGSAEAQAEVIRDNFKRGQTYTEGTTRVIIDGTPSIDPAFNIGGWYQLPVRIGFFADVMV